jgi:ArsR family transcriptional regulator
VNASTAVEPPECVAAELLGVAADPVRWRLLAVLAGGPRCVCELRPAAGVSAPALSHHLKVLRRAGLVTAARRGRWIDYALAPDAAQRLRAALPLPAGTGPVRADREAWHRER